MGGYICPRPNQQLYKLMPMVLKRCLRIVLFCLFFIFKTGFSQFSTKKKSNTDEAAEAVENKNPIVQPEAEEELLLKESITPLSAPQQTTISFGKLPAWITKMSNLQLESYLPFQFKYAILLNATVEKLSNTSLYKAIDEWFGTRYRFGGTTHRGIDCSAFMQVIAQYGFGWILPRTAREQYAQMQPVCKEDIHEGDFVFFHTTRRGVSHVGMYLHNNKFVHSSSSHGVMISDLQDKYWSARIIGFKRMGQSYTSL
jgi:murein DD-endopeptidase / murein LD-carboxypeptidase